MDDINNNALKRIAELKDSHFLVEDYQRGYKWTKTEVEQLLNDISEHKSEDISEHKDDGFYCLQPVVVKKVMDNDRIKIELIDGQQRITTLYIIHAYLGQKQYTIDYRTRKNSVEFLKKINDLKDIENDWVKYIDDKKEADNIDNYHFFVAYMTVKDWFKDKDDKSKTEFLNKLNEQVKVIWYEVPKSTDNSKQVSIKIFSRINSGKIQLTNAELIKALFLINVDSSENNEILQLKQNEIAQQWDIIEYALQNDAFWYFISNDEPPATRIEFIFDLIKKKSKKQTDKLYTFLEYNKDFAANSDKNKWVKNEWDKVYKTFLTLQEWYENRELYHLIGFLVCSNDNTISELYNDEKRKELSKECWINYIKSLIKDNVKTIDLDKANYNENKAEINNILLLYNIETELKHKESKHLYPFNRHKDKKNKWSLEHIHAQKEPELDSENKMVAYINDFCMYIKNDANNSDKSKKLLELNTKLNTEKPFNKNIFHEFMSEAKSIFRDLFNLHDIDNMALLSVRLNASIGNGFFEEKRNKIIDSDKKGEFIPVCTRNVFMKYYSKDSDTNLFYWSSQDRKNYLDDIKNTLKYYIELKK